MAKSTAVRAAARFRQLSCLGLDREAVIPELLKELHALIPSFSNSFHFADERGGLANIYFENTDLLRLWPLYQQQILERSERQVKGLAFSDGSREQVGVHEFNEAVTEDQEYFHRSDHYNLIVRRVGYDSNFLRLYFREKGHVLGGLTVWRSPSAVDWTAEDKRRLASLESFFIHALTAGKRQRGAVGRRRREWLDHREYRRKACLLFSGRTQVAFSGRQPPQHFRFRRHSLGGSSRRRSRNFA